MGYASFAAVPVGEYTLVLKALNYTDLVLAGFKVDGTNNVVPSSVTMVPIE